MQEVGLLLWSINDRLGGLPGTEQRGADREPLTLEWLNDVIRTDRFLAREIRQATEKREAELRKQAAEARRGKGRRR